MTTTEKQTFEGTEVTRMTETAAAAVEAQARAAVQSRYLMALQRPRDWAKARESLLAACRRPTFAAGATYSIPRRSRGETIHITGPSIRFAEEALRAATNVLIETPTILDDATKRIVRVSVTDLEANVCYTRDITVAKTVERSIPRKGEDPISVRLNTDGKRVYIYQAREDEVLMAQQGMISRAIRSEGMRVLPSDIVEEALEQVAKTIKDADSQQGTAEVVRRIVEAFAGVGVDRAQLETYLGHPVDQVSESDRTDLRGILTALKEKHATWEEILESSGVAADQAAKAQAAKPAPASRTEALAQKVAPQPDGDPPFGDDPPSIPIEPETAADLILELLTAAKDAGISDPKDLTAYISSTLPEERADSWYDGECQLSDLTVEEMRTVIQLLAGKGKQKRGRK